MLKLYFKFAFQFCISKLHSNLYFKTAFQICNSTCISNLHFEVAFQFAFQLSVPLAFRRITCALCSIVFAWASCAGMFVASGMLLRDLPGSFGPCRHFDLYNIVPEHLCRKRMPILFSPPPHAENECQFRFLHPTPPVRKTNPVLRRTQPYFASILRFWYIVFAVRFPPAIQGCLICNNDAEGKRCAGS